MKNSSPDLKKNGYVKKSMNGTSAEDTKTGTETEQNETASPEPAKAAPEAAQLEEAKKQVENYKDMLLRKAAEFENYKRRTENEMASAFKYAGEDILGELLPVMDDFERSLHSKLMGQVDLVRYGFDNVRDQGSFTLTSGILARFPAPGSAAFSLVNSALEGFVRAAALEAPRGIRINVVSPPWATETLEAQGRDPSPGLPAADIAALYVQSVTGALTGAVIEAPRPGV